VPRNVEIKARVRDLPALRRAVEAITDGPPALLIQSDTFFEVPRGRLKLRAFADGTAELISYLRSDVGGPRESRFAKAPVSDPAALAAVLSAALGTAGVVRKRRFLYRRGPTRIHLDEVEDLGSFLELEVELADDQSTNEGERVARELMARLGIAEEDLIATAYVDLLEDHRTKIEEQKSS
jgi:predicted adenylyl cyclase CyaB